MDTIMDADVHSLLVDIQLPPFSRIQMSPLEIEWKRHHYVIITTFSNSYSCEVFYYMRYFCLFFTPCAKHFMGTDLPSIQLNELHWIYDCSNTRLLVLFYLLLHLVDTQCH